MTYKSHYSTVTWSPWVGSPVSRRLQMFLNLNLTDNSDYIKYILTYIEHILLALMSTVLSRPRDRGDWRRSVYWHFPQGCLALALYCRCAFAVRLLFLVLCMRKTTLLLYEENNKLQRRQGKVLWVWYLVPRVQTTCTIVEQILTHHSWYSLDLMIKYGRLSKGFVLMIALY